MNTLGAGASKSPSLESIGPKSAPPKSPASDLPPMSSAAGLIPSERGFVKFARPDVPQNPSISVPGALIQIF
jgi:hypothetical protein